MVCCTDAVKADEIVERREQCWLGARAGTFLDAFDQSGLARIEEPAMSLLPRLQVGAWKKESEEEGKEGKKKKKKTRGQSSGVVGVQLERLFRRSRDAECSTPQQCAA